MNKQLFKVGDKVNDPQFGEGEVVQILDALHLFPLCVKFNNIGIEITYTLDGAYTHLSEPVLKQIQ